MLRAVLRSTLAPVTCQPNGHTVVPHGAVVVLPICFYAFPFAGRIESGAWDVLCDSPSGFVWDGWGSMAKLGEICMVTSTLDVGKSLL